jgi:hypothetical protein
MVAPRLATWPSGLGTGLQNPLHRFDSGRRLGYRMLFDTLRFPRALSSGGERFPDAEEVKGSNPLAPTQETP